MLNIFEGLPGTGKSTLAQPLARDREAVLLRIDTIEQALKETEGLVNGLEGYVVAYHIAADNLRLGLSVVADAVHPVRVTRAPSRYVAICAGVRLSRSKLPARTRWNTAAGSKHVARFEPTPLSSLKSDRPALTYPLRQN